MSLPEDMIGRPIDVGDFVIMYNNIYEVTEVGPKTARIILVNKSPTTRSSVQQSRKLCLLYKEDILVWKLKGGF